MLLYEVLKLIPGDEEIVIEMYENTHMVYAYTIYPFGSRDRLNDATMNKPVIRIQSDDTTSIFCQKKSSIRICIDVLH